MDNHDIRVSKLKMLVEEAGGPAQFARKYSRHDADKPISETYISQILNGHRAFREKAARNMEVRAGLSVGYFDNLDQDPHTKVYRTNNKNKQEMIEKILALPEEYDEHANRSLDLVCDITKKKETSSGQ